MDEQINPPQVPPSANPAPTPQTPSGPHGSSVKKIVIGVVSIALVAGASAAALYYIPRNNTGITSPTPTPAPSPVPAAPTSTPAVVPPSPSGPKFTDWVTVSWLPDLVLQKDDCSVPYGSEKPICGDGSVTNYLAGKITSGTYKDQNLYLEEQDGMGTYFLHYVLVNGNMISLLDEKIGIRGIDDLPDEINFPLKAGYKLKVGWVANELFGEIAIEKKLFKDPVLGDVFLAGNGCIIAQLPDGTAISYDFKTPFIDEAKGTVTATINNKAISEPYDFRVPTCAADCFYWNIVTADKLKPDTRLKAAGKSSNNETVYILADPNDAALKNIYNDKNTVAYYPNDGVSYTQMDHSRYTYEQFLALNPLLYWQDPLNRWIEFRNEKVAIAAEMCKPVIYLYPKTISSISVDVKPQGGFTYTEPAYNNGWKVLATPQGKLLDLGSYRVYDYLFWEGMSLNYPGQYEGFVVKKEDLSNFLNEKVSFLGLRGREIEDFKSYWVNRLSDKPYYKITFVDKADFDQIAPLSVSGNPDTIIRVLMTAKGLDQDEDIAPQALRKGPARHGFSVVEWGGAVLE
jgi:hypothetical protein